MAEKVQSDLMRRVSNGEPFWVALPGDVIRQLPTNLLMDSINANGMIPLTPEEIQNFKTELFRSSPEGQKQMAEQAQAQAQAQAKAAAQVKADVEQPVEILDPVQSVQPEINRVEQPVNRAPLG